MPEMTLTELARLLGGQVQGDGTTVVRGVSSLESASADEVAFLANQKYERYMTSTRAGAVIVSGDYSGPGGTLLRCKDAYFAFREAMVIFYGFRKPHFSGVDPRTDIHPSVKLGKGVCIAPFVSIGPGCQIGDNTVLYSGVSIGPRSRVGDDCILYSNVCLYDGTIVGNRVTVHACSSIGHDGFGYATHKGADGVVRHEKIPQAGWVELEDDVEIGACCTIDRATMGPTVIGAGTKFSNMVAIGHGTKMGRHCLMVAQSGIAGSVMVGNYCVFAGQAGVVGHIRIGDGVKVAAQAGVTHDLEAGLEVGGAPAIPLSEARRAWIAQSRLPHIRDTLKKTLRELSEIKKKLGIHNDGENGRGQEGV